MQTNRRNPLVWLLLSCVGAAGGCVGIPGVRICPDPSCMEEELPALADSGAGAARGLEGFPSLGPEDAAVTLVEFTDFQCPYCIRASVTIKELLAEYPRDLRVVVVLVPLPFNRESRPASLAALAAHKQGKFFPFHDRIWEMDGRIDLDELFVIAEGLGLDMERFQQDWASPATSNELARHEALAARFELRGVPQFFVNGEVLRGARPKDTFQEAIDEQLLLARQLRNQGVGSGALHRHLSHEAQNGLYRRYILDGAD